MNEIIDQRKEDIPKDIQDILEKSPLKNRGIVSAVANILRYTEGDATRWAFNLLSAILLENPNFKEEWLNERNPAYLIKNLIGAANEMGRHNSDALYCLSALLNNPNFKEEWLNPKSSSYLIPKMMKAVSDIAQSGIGRIISSSDTDPTPSTLQPLCALLKNPNFKEEWLNSESSSYL